MRHILEILNIIEAESSTNKKKELISFYKDDRIFYEVVQLALNDGISYGATDVNYNMIGCNPGEPYNIISELHLMSRKRGCSQEELDNLSSLIPDAGTAEVVRRILTKDLRCGAGAALFNEVDKNWVFSTPYQRYRSFKYIDKIDFNNEIIAQLKMDGAFSFFFADSGKFVSRNGSTFHIPEFSDKITSSHWLLNYTERVYIGELVVIVDGKALPRKQSNGIINSFISGKGDSKYVDNITYYIWGWVTEAEFKQKKSKTPYSYVWQLLNENHVDTPNVKLVESSPVKSLEEALEFYRKMRGRKEEGAIIKDATNLVWENDKSGSKYGIKLKPEVEAEFRIVDAYAGKVGKKYAASLGGLVISSEDRKIVTKIGMGFSDEERALGVDWWKQQSGKIITCRFTGITTDKSSRETWCLDHARFIETRFFEKTVADTYEYMLEQLEQA